VIEGIAQGPYLKLEWDSNLRPSRRKAMNLQLSPYRWTKTVGLSSLLIQRTL